MSQAAQTPRRPAGRYGDRPATARSRRRALMGVGAVLVLVAVLYAAWVAASSLGGVSFATLGYSHLDGGRLRVDFTVTRPAGSTAVCEVEALSSGAAQVGLTSVEVPPSPEDTTRVSAEVRTSERAVTGRPTSCVLR